ncbi:MAG: HDIG domain-containing protein [Bacteroidota bacterium]|nr:HDIG domain-containing protein [Rhodothermia bacterium]MDW8286141.1 HDIG domain-containing protein [Bacteroidota bacterium]
MFSLEAARRLMESWIQADSLRRHLYAVEAAMGYYARHFGQDEQSWRIVGVLHDLDYERHPSPEEHPYVAVAYLRTLGLPESWLEAILAHADYTGVPRQSLMARALYAVDEMSGFVLACAYVRPQGIEDLQPSSVLKKMKDKAFAAAVGREELRRGAEELGLPLEEHIGHVIAALRAEAERLGLARRA